MTNERRSCYNCIHLKKCMEKRRKLVRRPQHAADPIENEPIVDAIAEMCDEYEVVSREETA